MLWYASCHPLESVQDISVASLPMGDLAGSTVNYPFVPLMQQAGLQGLPCWWKLWQRQDDCELLGERTWASESGILQDINPQLNWSVCIFMHVTRLTGSHSFRQSISGEHSHCGVGHFTPSYEEMKTLRNRVLFVAWWKTQFGKAIICSDAAAEAASYRFTAIDRPEGYLVLAIESFGEVVVELKSPLDVCFVSLGLTFCPN